jgi:hypothetical protein
METYAVELTGHLRVTAIVTAESAQRAAEIAWWNETPREGETVTYSDAMECLDPDGPTVHSVCEHQGGQ